MNFAGLQCSFLLLESQHTGLPLSLVVYFTLLEYIADLQPLMLSH